MVLRGYSPEPLLPSPHRNMCACVFCLHACTSHVYLWPSEAGRGRCSGIGVTDSCGLRLSSPTTMLLKPPRCRQPGDCSHHHGLTLRDELYP